MWRKTVRREERFSRQMNPEDLIEALRGRLPRAKRHRGLALARPRTSNERAWLLIGLGVALRHRRDYDEALEAFDAAVALEPEPRAKRAAYICAMSVHRDRGDYEAARRISRSMPE
jgi:tetratricopeptide (TPR) repeat protein